MAQLLVYICVQIWFHVSQSFHNFNGYYGQKWDLTWDKAAGHFYFIFSKMTSVIWSDEAFEVRQVETGIKSGSNGGLKHIDHEYKVEH